MLQERQDRHPPVRYHGRKIKLGFFFYYMHEVNRSSKHFINVVRRSMLFVFFPKVYHGFSCVHSVLDSRTVSVFIPGKKYGEDADQSLSFPISCNFWALAYALTPCKKANRPEIVLPGSVVGSHTHMKSFFLASMSSSWNWCTIELELIYLL